MSFPPRPPMIPHVMPPNIMQQPPYTYTGMPMPPMPMMNMTRPPPNFNQIPNMTNKPPPIQHPVTKVFVGNISERVPDTMIRQMLQRCGSVLSWKRVEGTNGKLQAFGFCDFAEPQYTLRCIRLLNGYEIADKKLMVKVDQKTRELLGEFILKNRSEKAQTKNARKAAALRNFRGNLIRPDDDTDDVEEDPKNINLEAVDEDTLKEDRSTIGALELILKQFAADLEPPVEKVAGDTADEAEKVASGEAAASEAEVENSSEATDSAKNLKDGIYMKPHLRLEEIKLDDVKKELMTHEISKFRESHKEEELRLKQEEADRQKRIQEKDRDIKVESRDINSRHRDSRSSRERSPYRREPPRSEARERETRPPLSSRGSRSDFQRSRSRSQHNERREPSPRRRERRLSPENNGHSYREQIEMSSRSSVDRDRSQRGKDNLTNEELEEERERKKLERKLREKEMAYRARLKVWEEREEKKRKQYMAEKKIEMQKRKMAVKEAKKLRQFMEDYDDDNDDSNYFKGSNLEKKLKFREKEIESDNRDRQREKEELEELKKRLCEKGFSDVEHEAKRIQEDENLRMKHKFEKIEQSSSSSDDESAEEQMEAKRVEVLHDEPTKDAGNDDTDMNEDRDEPKDDERVDSMAVEESESAKTKADVSYSEESNSPYSQDLKLRPEIQSDTTYDTTTYQSPNSNSPTFQSMNLDSNDSRSASNTHHVLIKSVTVKKSIQPINQAFADEEDEPQGPHFKRAKLISTSDSNSLGMSSEERKKAVKKLVESIPTDRDELFAYKVDWEQLDEGLMEKRIKPWINKKIIEYIGEEEATLHDFICQKIQQKTEPGKLLEEIKVILDDEAELFVKKMWRLIVYETESKRCGLSR